MVVVPTADRDNGLPVVLRQLIGQPWVRVIDLARHANAELRISRSERRKILEVVQEQLRRLKARAEGANIQNADLYRLQRLRYRGNRAAIPFDDPQLVPGFLAHAPFQLGYQVVPQHGDVYGRAGRVPGPDAKREAFRRGGAGHETGHCCHGA